MQVSFLLALTGLLAILGYLTIFVALHLQTTGYNPVRHAVSDYALGRSGNLFRTGLWLSSAGVLALVVALKVGVGVPPLAKQDLAFLVLIPLARIGLTLFPTDLEGQRRTTTGMMHYVFAILAFTFTYLAISRLTPALQILGPSWTHSTLRALATVARISLILVVVTMLPRLRAVFGLFERLFLLSTNAWFVVVLLTLLATTH
jgi:hypothetical protein